MIKSLKCLLLALALGGCAMVHEEEKLPPQPTAQGVELIKQQGGRFIAFVGPRRQHTEPFLGVPDTNFFVLRSWLDNKTNETAHQLYVEDSYYGGPLNWDGVHDVDNKPLTFRPISRNEISCEQGCAYADEFAASLPEDYLRAHKNGLAVTFTSSNGKIFPVTVPAELVVMQLNALDSVRSTIATAANTTSPAPPATTATPPGPNTPTR
ncbi:MAG TPA: hypothetical protein VM782_18900 [Stellaceae bacterium]|nr:hypothetical protein [Stellaceae bacterium]